MPVHSTTLQRGTELPLGIHTIGSNTLMLINTLIDLGAMGQFLNIDYVWSEKLMHPTPPQNPVYNVE